MWYNFGMLKCCFVTAVLFAFRALAIDVIWDFLPHDVLSVGEYTLDVEIECDLFSQNYFFDDAFDVTQGSNTYTVSAKYLGWFCAANVGDVVSDATFVVSSDKLSVSVSILGITI